MSKKVAIKFNEFIHAHSPVQVSRHLRNILLDYLALQAKTGFPEDLHLYLWELYDLFDLLDCAADEEGKMVCNKGIKPG